MYGVDYALHGTYFGCDIHGCSAEEHFLIGTVMVAIFSVLGAVLIRVVVGPTFRLLASRYTRVLSRGG